MVINLFAVDVIIVIDAAGIDVLGPEIFVLGSPLSIGFCNLNENISVTFIKKFPFLLAVEVETLLIQ